MADTFIMRWPSLGKQVRCDKDKELNPHIFDWWMQQLPLKAVQCHTMVSGWCLYAVSVTVKTQMPWLPGSEAVEDLSLMPVGRVCTFSPVGESMEVCTKYDAATEYMDLISFAQVRAEDFAILREVGAKIWDSVISTKEIILVEYVKEEA
jgi:hypothetical protein